MKKDAIRSVYVFFMCLKCLKITPVEADLTDYFTGRPNRILRAKRGLCEAYGKAELADGVRVPLRDYRKLEAMPDRRRKEYIRLKRLKRDKRKL